MDASTTADRLDPRLIRIGLVVVFAQAMFVLDQTIVTVALATLGRKLDAQVATVQWVVTGYLLATAVVVPASGWATDRFGAKRLFAIAVALFTIASALCAAAWDVDSLIALRVLQGAAGALLLPVGLTILARVAGPQRMGRMMGLIGVSIILGPVLGPVLGGLIVDNLSWRWIFLVNLPIGALSLVLIARVLPSDQPSRAGEALDRIGLALAGPALALVVYGLSAAGQDGTFAATETWATIAVGVILAISFVLYARPRGDRALIPMWYFRDRAFSAASVVIVVISMVLFGAELLLPLYFQQVRGEDALVAGALLAPLGVGVALALPLAGRLTDTIGARRIVPVGMLLAAVGTLPFTQVSHTPSYWLLGAGLVVRGMGIGATLTPVMAAGYLNLPASAAAHASTALNIFQRVGATTGTALLSVILVTSAAAGPHTGTPGAPALADAYETAFWWATALPAAGIAIALWLPRKHRPPSSPAPNETATAPGHPQTEMAP